MARPTVICLTPVRNEAWILDRFLQCASRWADHILLADDRSVDASQEIARRFPKARWIAPATPMSDEGARRSLLLDAARQIAAPRLLIALDADEVLSAGAWNTAEWAAMLAAAPGTGFRFRMRNLRPDFQSCWDEPCEGLWAFRDDGSPFHGEVLHSRRLPLPAAGAVVMLADIQVLHYQYTDWARMRAKHRWYLCLERLLRPERRPLQVYRQYHHMDAVPRGAMRAVRQEWLAGYEDLGIDMKQVQGAPPYWFDREVVAMIDRHGAGHFRRQAIWETDWAALARRYGYELTERFRDPRTRREKAIHSWLRLTQRRSRQPLVRWLDGRLQRQGW
jgi:glycosyltransferase involved in cell wall biosynthesis